MKKLMNTLQKTFQLSETNYKDIDKILESNYKTYKKNKIEYINLSCSYDTETTSYINENGDKVGIMYAWVIGINGKCVIGRTWKTLLDAFKKISSFYNLSNEKRLIIYVHNLGFEFQFMRKRIGWQNVFASDDRTPIYALSNIGIEFRCSYLLSGYSLSNLGKNLHHYPVQKMDGDLNYKLLRHSETPLTDKETGYIIHDALVVMAYIQEMIEIYGNITKLALTNTGFVRQYCKKACYYSSTNHHHYDEQYTYYRKLMNSLTITSINEWQQFHDAFQGGFTHADSLSVGVIQHDVASYDFTSSYPSVIITEKYPMTRGILRDIKSREQMDEYMHDYNCIFTMYLKNVTSKIRYEHYISYSKCETIKNAVIDNGRVVSCDYLIITITEIDFKIIESCYNYDELQVKKFRTYCKQYLPTAFVKSVVKLYKDKTELKDVKGEEINYMLSKGRLNACYGMMVTNIIRDDIKYDSDSNSWFKEEKDVTSQLEKYNNDKKRFLFYLWGVYVTAYARYNLWTGIHEFKEDYIYSDTDSLKVINYKNHLDYIDNYNKEIKNKLQKACNYHHIPFEDVAPKNIKGVTKMIGVWDFENNGVPYKKFKTLGAKRYMYEDDNGLHITISGVKKSNGVDYLMHEYKNIDAIFDAFKDGLEFPKEYAVKIGNKIVFNSATGKNTHIYQDNEINGKICDYTGVTKDYNELSSIYMEGCDYNLSLSRDFIDYLMNVKERWI